MSQIALPGVDIIRFPDKPPVSIPPALASVTAISAAGDQYGIAGTLVHKSGPGATVNIVGIEFFAGAIVSAGGTTLKTGLQGVQTGATAVQRPDGAYKGAGAAFGTALLSALSATASNTITIPSTACTVGANLGVMFEFTGYGGADSFTLRGLSNTSVGTTNSAGNYVRQTGGTWAVVGNDMAAVSFLCDDGSYAKIINAMPCNALTAGTFNTGATRQNGMFFNLPMPITIYGAWAIVNPAANSTGSLIIATDPVGTPAIQVQYDFTMANQRISASASYIDAWFSSAVSMDVNTPFILYVDSSSANNLTEYYISLQAAAQLDCYSGQNQCRYTRAGTSGAFSIANSGKDFPFMGLYIGKTEGAAAAGGTSGIYSLQP